MRTFTKGIFLLGILFLINFLSPLFVNADAERENEILSLKIALIGPGTPLYFWWGHIGLLAEGELIGTSRFYDWGIFDFNDDNFLYNFTMGDLIFYCAVSPADWHINYLVQDNRDIIFYTLDLDLETKLEILRFAENNILPENRRYNYHHFRDNCATRIRDILDMAVGGQFYAELGNAPGRFTLREQLRRHTHQSPFFDWFLNFLMGQNIDVPITAWDDMFLPSEVIRNALDFEYTDRAGSRRPLISHVEYINASQNRPVILDEPYALWPLLLVFSLLISIVLFLFYFFVHKRKCFMPIMGSLNILLGLFFGITGSLLFFMSFFSAHDYSFNNANIIFINPLLLTAIPLGITMGFTKNMRKRLRALRFLRMLWSYVFLSGVLSMLIKLFPAYYQENHFTHALVLPFVISMVVILTLFYWRKT